ncbi:MAG: gliding motility-associated-like protein [Polaribacter sp.]|jgi:gliding motility-associated-like protein
MNNLPLAFCVFNLLLSSAPLSAQKAQAAHWYFGDHYGLDFSNGAPLSDSNNSIYTYEACTTISDKNGALLFYTNGGGRANQAINGYIWNSNHEIMEGGDLGFDKGGGYSSAQGAISLKKPGSDSIYYLFTVDEKETLPTNNINFPEGKGARFFEIDMNANGGLGKVTLSNQELFTPAFEYQAATIHNNCIDFWLIVPTGHYEVLNDPMAADSFYIYLVNNNGPSLIHKIPMVKGNEHTFDEYGPIKISPDGSRMICGGQLYHFDNSSGLITHQEDLQYSISMNYESPTAFSPDGKLLYEFQLIIEPLPDEAAILHIKQYELDSADLSSTTTLLTMTELVSYAKVGGPQLAPDGKLYFIVQNGTFSSPTALAAINHPNEKGVAAAVDLDVLTLSNTPDSRFLKMGNYSDHIFFNEATLNDYDNETIVLDCQFNTDIDLTAPPEMDCYYWSTGSTSESITATDEGFYWVEYWQGCQLEADSFFIIYENEHFDFHLGEDLLLCGDDSIQLSAPEFPDMNYLWQNGDSTNSLIVNQAGFYHLSLRRGDCTARDSVYISKKSIPAISLEEDAQLCLLDTLRLEVGDPDWDHYEWQDGSQASFFEVTQSGKYSVTIENECGTASDEIEVSFIACGSCPVYVPTAFSPNGDWTNELFKVYSSCDFLDFQLQIFDRWGSQVFGSSNPENGWDGILKGQLAQAGAYVYKLDYKWIDLEGQLQTEEVYGPFSLIR